jgi:hypothetical protein
MENLTKSQKNKLLYTFSVDYDRKVGGIGNIIVKAINEKEALKSASDCCFTGSNFRNAKKIDNSLYVKPSKQGFQGSGRMNNY